MHTHNASIYTLYVYDACIVLQKAIINFHIYIPPTRNRVRTRVRKIKKRCGGGARTVFYVC